MRHILEKSYELSMCGSAYDGHARLSMSDVYGLDIRQIRDACPKCIQGAICKLKIIARNIKD